MACWAIASLAAMLTAVAAIRAAFATRGSTAVPATLWAIVASVALLLDTAARASGIVSQPAAAGSLRMVTASLSLCPAMSLLGAKRPQHGVWQLIVAALAVILLLPALSTALVRPDSVPAAHLLGRCFLVILALVGWMNFVATRHGTAATLVTLGQLVVVRGFLPLVDSEPAFPPTGSSGAPGAAFVDAIGACLAAAGGLLALARSRRTPPSPAAVTTPATWCRRFTIPTISRNSADDLGKVNAPEKKSLVPPIRSPARKGPSLRNELVTIEVTSSVR